MKPFTKRAVEIIKHIPPGKVMTYGQVAALAGSPRGARQVVRILHSMSKKYHLPWHRVLPATGEISMKNDVLYMEQKRLLEMEGVEFFEGHRIHLDDYQFHPEIMDVESSF